MDIPCSQLKKLRGRKCNETQYLPGQSVTSRSGPKTHKERDSLHNQKETEIQNNSERKNGLNDTKNYVCKQGRTYRRGREEQETRIEKAETNPEGRERQKESGTEKDTETLDEKGTPKMHKHERTPEVAEAEMPWEWLRRGSVSSQGEEEDNAECWWSSPTGISSNAVTQTWPGHSLG